eukprot:scaffold11260_cov37-Attheya_sp.AAC.2
MPQSKGGNSFEMKESSTFSLYKQNFVAPKIGIAGYYRSYPRETPRVLYGMDGDSSSTVHFWCHWRRHEKDVSVMRKLGLERKAYQKYSLAYRTSTLWETGWGATSTTANNCYHVSLLCVGV